VLLTSARAEEWPRAIFWANKKKRKEERKRLFGNSDIDFPVFRKEKRCIV